MEELLLHYLNLAPTVVLLVIVAVMLYTLGKGADILVDQAVSLSINMGIPKMVVGATIVSLGTTLPEATISVLAAVKGNPDLALGNAIGSIIADTGLIIGLAAMMGNLPVDKNTINRQGRIQFLAGVLLAVVCLPIWTTKVGFIESFNHSGNIPQFVGFIFLGLLVAYIFMSIRWAKKDGVNNDVVESEKPNEEDGEKTTLAVQLLKMGLGVVIVIASSRILIPSVEITAIRVGIPQAIIAATLVAFGTSLPELVTAITAVRKGHGELAIGNIVGADILNVLFVVGSAAAVTPSGLRVPGAFYHLQIPTMLLVLGIFRMFSRSGKDIDRKEGMALFAFYAIYLVLNFVL